MPLILFYDHFFKYIQYLLDFLEFGYGRENYKNGVKGYVCGEITLHQATNGLTSEAVRPKPSQTRPLRCSELDCAVLCYPRTQWDLDVCCASLCVWTLQSVGL